MNVVNVTRASLRIAHQESWCRVFQMWLLQHALPDAEEGLFSSEQSLCVLHSSAPSGSEVPGHGGGAADRVQLWGKLGQSFTLLNNLQQQRQNRVLCRYLP